MINAENKKQLAILLCAIGLGFIATWATSQYVENKISKQAEWLAKEATKKNAAMLSDLELMKKELSRVRAQQESLARKQAQMKIPAVQQQIIQETKKTTPGKITTFSLKTPYGKRALTIMIDSLSAVGGLITAGDFIDILAHFSVSDNVQGRKAAASKKTTSILFQNIQVLAVGTRYSQSVEVQEGEQRDVLGYEMQQKSRSLYVTLAVTPEEAGLLTFVQAQGNLQLILRSPQEDTTQILQVASWDALAEFVLDHQGTELDIPRKKAVSSSNLEIEEAPAKDEVKPFIQIFKSGRELNL